METVRRTQGCWTCKSKYPRSASPLTIRRPTHRRVFLQERKIGCDRGYPACNNCLRTGRECLGYGIRLAWPDQPDGRRRGSRVPDRAVHSSPHNSAHYGEQFLNMTYEDLMHSGKGLLVLNELLLLRNEQRPVRSMPLLPKFHERESHLLRYYHDKLSQMISTININNGFRDDLIPMALTTGGKASHGLRNAILAVSAFHLWGPEHALTYKTEAIRSLSSSLSTESFGTTETQLATSMMLCVYNWPHGPASLRLLRDTHFDTSMIIGSLGCSVEVMEVISHVNKWRAMELSGEYTAFPDQERSNRAIEYKALESKLALLTQRLDPRHEEHLSRYDRTRTLATAELYRIATFLYLHRVGSPEPSPEIKSAYLQQALQVLGSLEVCTSPWPLFVIACETENDEQRISILRTLDRMDEERHIGNVFVLRHIIESFWKQQDLQADSGRTGSLKWWDTIDLNLNAPWFI
ncbi:hypothetical protein FHL15_007135 [Xylaria flabelliformis]|uniref:Zn(2)-C6 fungal-type domain-containing protein n=1 Tax=Xylaria flabelliformis TaxID=2512241 RepID=A0A553HVS5_9PEZI|nr:hypothetical protein FHL15_007135 [Xylaria flabelliformis]